MAERLSPNQEELTWLQYRVTVFQELQNAIKGLQKLSQDPSTFNTPLKKINNEKIIEALQLFQSRIRGKLDGETLELLKKVKESRDSGSTFVDIAQELAQKIDLPTVVLPTDVLPPIIIGEGSKPITKGEYDPQRLEVLKQIISELELKIILELDGIIPEGCINREYSYRFYYLSNGVITAMCPQFKEATFVMTLDGLEDEQNQKDENGNTIELTPEDIKAKLVARLTAISQLTKLELRNPEFQSNLGFTFIRRIKHDKDNNWQNTLEATILNPILEPDLEGLKKAQNTEYTEEELLAELRVEDRVRYEGLPNRLKDYFLKYLRIKKIYIDNNVYPTKNNTVINNHTNHFQYRYLENFEIGIIIKEFRYNFENNMVLSETQTIKYNLYKAIKTEYLSKNIIPTPSFSRKSYKAYYLLKNLEKFECKWLKIFDIKLYQSLHNLWNNKEGRLITESQYKTYTRLQEIAININLVKMNNSEYNLINTFKRGEKIQWLHKYDERLAEFLMDPKGEPPVPRVVESEVGGNERDAENERNKMGE